MTGPPITTTWSDGMADCHFAVGLYEFVGLASKNIICFIFTTYHEMSRDYFSFKIDGTDGRLVPMVTELHVPRTAVMIKTIGEALERAKQQGIALSDLLTDTEIRVNLDDHQADCINFTISGLKEHGHLLFPEAYSIAWPEVGVTDVQSMVKEMNVRGAAPASIPKAVWVGATSHPSRIVMLARIALDPSLKELVEAWAMSWQDPHRKLLSLPDHVNYKYVIDVEGTGWSARLKYLLCSRRPAFVMDRPFWDWATFDLQPWVHYIPVERDSSDLLEKIRWAEDHPEEAQAIADNAAALMMARLEKQHILDVIVNRLMRVRA